MAVGGREAANKNCKAKARTLLAEAQATDSCVESNTRGENRNATRLRRVPDAEDAEEEDEERKN